MRPLYQSYSIKVLTGTLHVTTGYISRRSTTDAQTERPYKGLLVKSPCIHSLYRAIRKYVALRVPGGTSARRHIAIVRRCVPVRLSALEDDAHADVS